MAAALIGLRGLPLVHRLEDLGCVLLRWRLGSEIAAARRALRLVMVAVLGAVFGARIPFELNVNMAVRQFELQQRWKRQVTGKLVEMRAGRNSRLYVWLRCSMQSNGTPRTDGVGCLDQAAE
jgi:hypothetical protein